MRALAFLSFFRILMIAFKIVINYYAPPQLAG